MAAFMSKNSSLCDYRGKVYAYRCGFRVQQSSYAHYSEAAIVTCIDKPNP